VSKPLDPLLGPRLSANARAIEHGNRIVSVDANCSASVPVIRLRDICAVRALDAELSFMPVNNLRRPIAVELPIFAEFERFIAPRARLRTPVAALQSFAFYKRTPEDFAVVAARGTRLDHDIAPNKGVIPPDGVRR
jgi:L-fucose mutarotase/ribose pyranase (RbsD/FucU family)